MVARWCTEVFQKGVAAHLLVNEVGGSLHCNCSHLPFLLLSPGLLPFNGKTKNSMRQDDPSPWKRAHPEGWLDGYEDELAVNSDFSNFASDTISSCTSNWMTKELNETCLNFMTLPQKLAGWPGITLLWVVSKGRGRLYRCRMDLVMKQRQVKKKGKITFETFVTYWKAVNRRSEYSAVT